jgi:hypothetical protein
MAVLVFSTVKVWGIEQHKGAKTMKSNKTLPTIITKIATKHGLDLTKVGCHLRVHVPGLMPLSIEVIGDPLVSVEAGKTYRIDVSNGKTDLGTTEFTYKGVSAMDATSQDWRVIACTSAHYKSKGALCGKQDTVIPISDVDHAKLDLATVDYDQLTHTSVTVVLEQQKEGEWRSAGQTRRMTDYQHNVYAWSLGRVLTDTRVMPENRTPYRITLYDGKNQLGDVVFHTT